jgi:hypothetical protein
MFQFSTSILCLLEDENSEDITISMQDDKQDDSKEGKELKDFKTEFINHNDKLFSFFSLSSSNKTQFTYVIKKYIVSSSIVVPPPKEV